MKYSWYNKTDKISYFWEEKELLQIQRNQGNECVNIEQDFFIPKEKLKKGPSETMKKRILKIKK